MPHLVISYARPIEDSVDIAQMVQLVWDTAEKTGLFNPAAIKARALPVEHFVTANTDQPFVHVDAKLFAGRTDEQKQAMIQDLFNALKGLVPDTVSISVEAIDMDKQNYIKS
nr:5-carboxymethyl-2-hydroxymuconate Delta-isomerase [uncultured Cohaesibacter sp.]